jgi:hypothetical protein
VSNNQDINTHKNQEQVVGGGSSKLNRNMTTPSQQPPRMKAPEILSPEPMTGASKIPKSIMIETEFEADNNKEKRLTTPGGYLMKQELSNGSQSGSSTPQQHQD